jgi:two-component system OmpR family sensor kinase
VKVPRVRLPRLVPRTLRGRLTAGVVVILGVLCVGLGFATTAALSHFLVDRLDQQLVEAGARYAQSLEHPDQAASTYGDARAQSPGTFGARLLNGSVTVAAVVDGDADDERGSVEDSVALTARDRRELAALPADGSVRTLELSSLGAYRLLAQNGRDGDVLITGLPLEHAEQTVHELAAAEAAMFAAALALAALAAALWVRLALRPLDRVARTAERVSGLSLASGEVELSVRVPDAGAATEVGRVGASFNRMLGHVEDALAKRHAVEGRLRSFAADASHELRTPVATIRGHAELALRHPGGTPEPVRRSLGRIEAEARRMGVLVEDLLLLARLDAGRPLAREQVDLTRLALDAVEDARAAAPGHRWRLELPAEPTTVVGDRHRLAQAVANLLANARTHTPEGTEVTLRLDDAARDGDAGHDAAQDAAAGGEVRLSVTDTGPGLPPELADRAFERFVRGDRARSRATGSTGLGLAITRAIAEAHHGRIELESAPGRTVFTLVLPSA